ncbi:hypothetical protein N5P37_005837, partial [Trichoderma harzianum]
ALRANKALVGCLNASAVCISNIKGRKGASVLEWIMYLFENQFTEPLFLDYQNNMAEQLPRLIIFGDQDADTLSFIKGMVLKSRNLPYASRFLRDCADEVQVLLSGLDAQERRRYSRFEDILELVVIHAELVGRSLSSEAISTVLFFISQFGDLMVRAKQDPSLLSTSHKSLVYIVGLSFGLLPATAAATARDVGELLAIGRALVAVVFRLGLQQTRKTLETESTSESWATEIANIAPQEVEAVVNAFNNDMVGDDPCFSLHVSGKLTLLLKRLSQNTGAFVLSGPPSLFSELYSYSLVLASASKTQLSLKGLSHAPHLPPVDINEILGASSVLRFAVRERVHVVSTSSSRPFEGQDLGSMLSEALVDITQRMQNLIGVSNYCISEFRSNKTVELVTIGPQSQAGGRLREDLEAGGVCFIIRQAIQLNTEGVRDGSDLVAVIGMSSRLPGSEDVDNFWENLQAGLQFESEIPASRFDLQIHYDATGARKNTTTSCYGCFLENPGFFDNQLFNTSPREAEQMDPVHRILLMCSYEALQMAGYSPEATLSTNRNRIATYFAQAGDDYRECARAFAPGRLHNHYKWAGASYSVDTACSGSSTCIILAINALLSRECDTALAGGGSILTAPDLYAGLSRAGFLTKTPGGCKTFREDADGYCRAEGVGLVVLKRLEDAVSDNDNILAVLRRGARNSSWSSISITHPSADAQASAVREVLRNAGVEPKEIGFIEMHGTGTQAGDAIEMETVSRVFGNDRTKENPLYVGSVKPSVGHGEAASGVTSLIKAIEMLRNNAIPPQAGFPGPRNKRFAYIEELNIRIPETNLLFQPSPFSRDGKRRILISNFDASGGNNAMLLEDAPVRQEKTGIDLRSHQVVAISAKTMNSLKKNTERLLMYLEHHQDIRLCDLAYTTTARRIHEDLRRSYAVESVDQLRQLLETDLRKDSDRNISPVKRSSIVFTFTGQGSQYGGMGKQLFATSPRFRQTVESLHDICKWHGFPSFLDLIASGEASIERYSSVQTQLAITVLEIALADLWKPWDIEPDFVIGYSLGEYTALYVAGVLSIHDVLYLVGRRAILMQEKCSPGTHAMLAIQASQRNGEEKIFSYPSCEISCKGAPKSTVVSGSVDDLVSLQSQLKTEGYSCTLLDVPYGFHSSQVDPILDDFGNIAEKVNFGKPRIPVASTLVGAVVRDEGGFSPSYLANQARRPVDFMGALEACRNENLVDDDSVWIEIGPKPVLSSLIGNALNVPRRKLLHTINNKEEDWKAISKSMASAYLEALPINWTNVHRDYVQFLNLLELPSYAFDLKNYWITTKKASQVEVQTLAGTQSTPSVPGFPTTALQLVQEESFEELKAVVTFESMMCEPAFLSIAQRHIINGVPLFPGSTFVDMAFSAAKYIYQRTESGSPVPAMSLANLIMTHPLIPDLEALGNNDASINKSKTNQMSTVATANSTRKIAQRPADLNTTDVVMEVILDMTGIDPADVEPFTRISDIGLDSILTIEVIGELRNKTGMELPTSFFIQNPTVADVKRALGHPGESKANVPSQNSPLVSRYGRVEGDPSASTRDEALVSIYCSNIVLVQGRATSDKIPLFLIADGGGSATSYMSLSPLFPGNNLIYGRESPFLDNPEDYVYTIEEVSNLYAAAIRKIRPHGPYLLGGWSLGALFAFEVSKRFLYEGDIVQGLFVLDFKLPALIEDKNWMMPRMETVEMIGMANGLNVPGKGIWAPATYKAKLHSLQSLRATAKYKMQPMGPGYSPLNTYVVWAGLGLETLLGEIPAGIQEILKAHSDPNTNFRADAMLLWLFGARQKHEEPDGWDEATRGPVHCSSLLCDHFTMFNKPFSDDSLKRYANEISLVRPNIPESTYNNYLSGVWLVRTRTCMKN